MAWILAAAVPAQAQGSGSPYVPGRYIVVLKSTVAAPAEVAARMAQQHGLRLGHVYDAAIKGFSAVIPPARVSAVASDPRVQSLEQDRVVQISAKPSGGSSPGAQPAQVVPKGIDRIDADQSSAQAGNGSGSVDVDIAIIDTGIQPDHPDLNVVGGANFAPGKSYKDGHGHGTHVAGTAAARDNGIGVVGVAPGARLWAVRVLDNAGFGALSWIIAGVNWVTARADTIEVANMSLGFQGTSDALNTAITNSIAAGVTYVVAAGNENADASGFSPANHPGVIAVGAIADSDGMCGGLGALTSYGADDTFASFSNDGDSVDLVAPGVNILSTFKGSGYAVSSGTSMATPHVSGAAALYKAANPSASPSDVRTALIALGTPQGQSCQVDATGRERGGYGPDAEGDLVSAPLLDAGDL
jgi:subtilisin family serine protease